MSDDIEMVTFEDFEKLDIRVGKVVKVTPFPEGKYSTHVLLIDFGAELGEKKSLAKLTPNYEGDEVIGRQVLCVVNFPPRQIGKHQSEVLMLGVPASAAILRRPRAVTEGVVICARLPIPIRIGPTSSPPATTLMMLRTPLAASELAKTSTLAGPLNRAYQNRDCGCFQTEATAEK